MKNNILFLKKSGSTPELCIDPIQAAVDFHLKYRKLKEKFKDRKIVSTLPILRGGERFNVIPSECIISGTLRNLEEGFESTFKEELVKALEELKSETKVNYELDWNQAFPITANTEAEAGHI